jgi:hypothetical protein
MPSAEIRNQDISPPKNSHPAQNPGLEEKTRRTERRSRRGVGGKLSKY